jgi:uncharacterized protein YacL (UPF0231 family)
MIKKNRLSSRCKKCSSAHGKLWRSINKEKVTKSAKTNYLKNKEKRIMASMDRYYNNDKFFSVMANYLKQSAKRRNLPYDLDQVFLRELYFKQNERCALTGIEFNFIKIVSSYRRPFLPSIDRIDSNLGYIKNNVRLVCTIVNLALNDFGDEAFDKICRAYVKLNDEQIKNSICSNE